MVHLQLDLLVMFPKKTPKTHKHLSWVPLKEKTKLPLFDLGFKERARQEQRETIVLVCSLAAAHLPSPRFRRAASHLHDMVALSRPV